MVLTKAELLACLQKEVRILLHLAGKLDETMLDYRPTPKQRSAFELLQYLSFMGPQILKGAKAGAFDPVAWTGALEAAGKKDFAGIVADIAAQPDQYAAILADMQDADFRKEYTGFDGKLTTRGAFIVDVAICGYAAYRTQLFVYLKSCGREELSTPNLWRGADPAPAAV